MRVSARVSAPAPIVTRLARFNVNRKLTVSEAAFSLLSLTSCYHVHFLTFDPLAAARWHRRPSPANSPAEQKDRAAFLSPRQMTFNPWPSPHLTQVAPSQSAGP